MNSKFYLLLPYNFFSFFSSKKKNLLRIFLCLPLFLHRLSTDSSGQQGHRRVQKGSFGGQLIHKVEATGGAAQIWSLKNKGSRSVYIAIQEELRESQILFCPPHPHFFLARVTCPKFGHSVLSSEFYIYVLNTAFVVAVGMLEKI